MEEQNTEKISDFGTWVPISERLPGKWHWVLWTLIDGKNGKHYMRTGMMRNFGDDSIDVTCANENIVPIAWMQLPKPYTEGKAAQ